ncbi:MAG: potassium channel family protein [Desulfurococcales archaeon]|nr:potassium channel family protein [Desulfurococcales archaeon]
MDDDVKVLTPGFRLLLDIIASAVGAGLAYSFAATQAPGPGMWADAAYSAILAVTGIVSGVPGPLLAASSLPVAVWGLIPAKAALLAPLLARAARFLWDVRILVHGMSRLGRMIDTLLIQAGILAAIALVGGALSLYMVESGAQGSGVSSVWDAFWLALVTITTVGYGDVVPSTPEGRAIASLLMLVGIGLFTFFLSSLASGISRIATIGEEPRNPLERRKKIIAEMIRNIEELGEEDFNRLKAQLDLLYLLATAERRVKKGMEKLMDQV